MDRPASRNMRNIEISSCTKDDLRVVRRIEKLSFHYPYNNYIFKHFLKLKPDTFLIAKLGGTLAGYVISTIKDEKGLIATIAVHPDYRRRGVGKTLMEEAIRMCEGRAKEVEIHVRTDNHGAIKFYQELGFTKRFKIPGYYQDGRDCHVMRVPVGK